MSISFEDSLKKAQAEAEAKIKNSEVPVMPLLLKNNDISVASIEDNLIAAPLTADETNGLIAAYDGWMKPDNASFYTYYDNEYYDDNFSIVDENKNITLSSEQINLTQEKNSQYIPFEIPRYYDGFDLTKTEFSIYWVNKNGNGSSAIPVDVYYNSDKIRFAWLVDDDVTSLDGKIKFEIQASGTNSQGFSYLWKTKVNEGLNVIQALEIKSFIEPDETWQENFIQKLSAQANIAEAAKNEAVAASEEVKQAVADLQDGISAEVQSVINENYYTKNQVDEAVANVSVDLTGYATESYVKEQIENADLDSYYKKEETYNQAEIDEKFENVSIDLTGYATEAYVQEQIESIPEPDMSSYALKSDIPTIPTDVSVFTNDAGYLTEHQSLEAYALKSEVPSVEGLATETYVQEQIENADLDGYYKKSETYNQTEIDEKLSNVSVDLTGYATEKYVDDKTAPLSSSISTNAENISSLSTTVGSLQNTVNSIDTSSRLTYDVVYNDAEDPNVGENVFVFYEIENEGKENEVRETKKKFTIVGGSGGSVTSSSLKIGYVTTSPFVVTTNDDAIIKYTFSGTDSSGDIVTEGTATWKVAGRVVATNTALAGENSFDITEYLSIGTQKVNLSIVDEAGSLVTKTWTVQKIDVRLESTFNDKLTYSIGKVSFDYTPYGAISKDIHFILDGKEIGKVTTASSGIPMAYELPNQTHGSHLLEVYMTAEINGNKIESNHIIKDILWYDGVTSPVIGSIYQNFTARQYDTTNIEYTVYDPTTEVPTVEITVDGNIVSTPTLNEATNIYSFKTDIVGEHIIAITCGETVKTLKVNITKLDINISPVTAGLVFDFNPSGKSNNDSDRVWSNDTVSMSVSDNFDWVNGGYQYDENGDPYFCIKAGTNVELDYQMFADDAKKTGKEMKLIFKTTNVQESNAQFMSCVDNTTGADNIGIEMFVHEAFIYGSADKLNLKYSENDIIEFEFNITKNTEDVTEICGYEDGVPTRHLVYDDTFNFTQANPKIIKLGSEKCDLYIYRLKVYNTSLTDRGVLNNFIADARNAEEMINRYDRNQIYDENSQLTPETLAEKCPWLRVYVVSAPYFTNKKSDKVPYTTIRQIYKNGDPILDNWTCYDCSHSGQGTSSDNYGASARNLDFIMNKSQREGVKPYFILGDGKTRVTTVSLTRTSIPNAYFNFKANVASSNHFTNALLAKRYNQFNPYTLPYVREDESIIDYIKTTMEFYNAVVFIQETDDDLSTHREFADKDIHFYSIGNIGDSKKTDDTRLVDPTDKYECINEICDVELPLSDWPNTPEAIDALEAEKFDKSGSYEWRYIWEDGTDEENEEVREYCKQRWIEMYKFVVQSTDEEFKANFSNYFVLDSVLYYYLFTTRYCMVDNRAKNSFWHYAKTGEVDAQGNPIRKWNLTMLYDADSSMSLNNYGNSVYRHGYEDTDTLDGTTEEVFRESDSTFFCRVRDLFTDELKEAYNSLESKNTWHSESFLNEIEAWQKQFPEELWRLDCKRKYIRTVNESFINGAGDPQYIKNMAQGRMLYAVKQWERSQEAYMASKYQSSVASSDNAVLRCTVPSGNLAVPVNYRLKLTPYDYMYLNVKYGTQEPIQVRANPNVQYEIPFDGDSVDILDIYSVSRIKDLGDLSSTYPATVDTAKASRLKELHIGNSTVGYDNPNLTTMTLGANYLLEVLNVENVSGLTQSLNLSALNNLRELYAHGTNTGGVTFADGGKIEIAELPAINALSMKNLIYLTTFDVADFSKLTTLTVENCNTVDLLNIFENATNINRIRIAGIDWILEDTVLLEKLYAMKGIDKNGYNTDKSILSGKVYVPVIRQQQLYNYQSAWTDLEITFGTMIEQYAVTFVNDDENHTVLEVQYVDKGSDAIDPVTRENNPIPIPVKESTVSTDFEYAGWDSSLTGIFSDRTITATYTESTRSYTVKYVSKGITLQESIGLYGDNIVYEGVIPTYTLEEGAYKYYMFNRWDKSGFVDGNKVINAVFDSFEYTPTAFDGKELKDLSPVEIYALTKLGLDSVSIDIQDGDDYSFDIGYDIDYDDIDSELIISEKQSFNGTNHIDTGIKLFDEDRDFVLAMDYEFSNESAMNGVLAQCFQSNGSNGFKLWYNNGIKFTWGTSSDTPAKVNSREMLVIRHKKGENNITIYNSNLESTESNVIELTRTKNTVANSTLVFGCMKADDGAYENHAIGNIHWCKVWYTDLGEDICRELVGWVHEKLTFEVDGFKRYYLSENTSKRCSFSLLAKNLLSHNMPYGYTSTNSGGWANSALNDYLNTRFYNSMPAQIKALLKQVIVSSSVGSQSTELSSSNCYINIPAVIDVSNESSINIEPYIYEGSTISYMTSNEMRKRAYNNGGYGYYWLRSPNISYSNPYIYQVDNAGKLYGFGTAMTKAGVLIEISF